MTVSSRLKDICAQENNIPDHLYVPPVTDGSGDPDRIYYIPPPDRGLIGLRWVVWCGIEPGIYTTW